jgi:hypothetical protein
MWVIEKRNKKRTKERDADTDRSTPEYAAASAIPGSATYLYVVLRIPIGPVFPV